MEQERLTGGTLLGNSDTEQTAVLTSSRLDHTVHTLVLLEASLSDPAGGSLNGSEPLLVAWRGAVGIARGRLGISTVGLLAESMLQSVGGRLGLGHELGVQEDVVEDWLAGQGRDVFLRKFDAGGVYVDADDLLDRVGMCDSSSDETDRSASPEASVRGTAKAKEYSHDGESLVGADITALADLHTNLKLSIMRIRGWKAYSKGLNGASLIPANIIRDLGSHVSWKGEVSVMSGHFIRSTRTSTHFCIDPSASGAPQYR